MIVLDTETTGTDPQSHALISLGAVEFENPDNQFYSECRVWEGAKIKDEALEVNGFTREDITDPNKESLEVLIQAFLRWTDKCAERTIAGHNVEFDIGFLKDSTRRVHLPWEFADRSIDTHSLTYMHLAKRGEDIPSRNNHSDVNSDFVFDYVGLDIERETHNALEDAKLTAEAISRLLYDKPLLDEFSNAAIPWLK